MKNYLFPYGNRPFETLINCARKEFGSNQIKADSYTELKTEIKREINRQHTKKSAINEYYLKTLSEKEHQNQYHMISYFSMKYAAHALIISVISLIMSNLGLSFPGFFTVAIFIWMSFTIIVSYRAVHQQQGQVEYLQFKLRCLKEIVKPEQPESYSKSQNFSTKTAPASARKKR